MTRRPLVFSLVAILPFAAACNDQNTVNPAPAPSSAGGSGGKGGGGGAAGQGGGDRGGGGAGGSGGAGGGSAGSSGAGGGGTDPVWGDLSVACPADMPGTGDPALLGGLDCDPLDPGVCGFPFPNDVYLADDPNTPSGKSVHLGKGTLPQVQGKFPIDPSLFYDRDGFSPGQGPLYYFPGAVQTGLVQVDHIADSVDATKTNSFLLDTSTGQLVPHWVDLDLSTHYADERALILRPAVRLKDKTRYIVAYRNVQDMTGATIPPSPFFKALRDGTMDCAPALAALRKAKYDDIFLKLKAAGIDTSQLQIAWDYTTSSRESNTQDLVFMRDDALKKYPHFQYRMTCDPSALSAPPGMPAPVCCDPGVPQPCVTPAPVDNVAGDGTMLGKRVNLKVTLPLYLNFAEPYDGTMPDKVPALQRGSDGKPVQNGEFEFDVLVLLPQQTSTSMPGSLGLLQNGHGLLGSRREGQSGYLATMANKHGYVAFAVNLMGFDETDVPLVEDALAASPEKFKAFIDRQTQGHLNQLLAMRFMMNDFVMDPLVQVPGPNGKMASVIDPTLRVYRGDSQGGIMGTTYMSISTDVTRGLLGEPGMPYNLLLNRSIDYSAYGVLLSATYKDGRSIQMILSAFQMIWDRTEPDGYAPYIVSNTLPCESCPGGVTPSHAVLIHDAIGDCQVTPFGAHILARTVGAKNLEPVNREIYMVDDAALIPPPGSGIVEYDFGLPATPLGNVPPGSYCTDSSLPESKGDPHDTVRKLGPSYDQSDHFFRTGEIKPYCNGTCSCNDATPEEGCPP